MPDGLFSAIDAANGLDAPVTLAVNGKTIAISESYEFATSVLEVPTSFSLRVGHNGTLRDLLAACPPHAPYELSIARILQASGRLDGFDVPSDDGTSLELRGRDKLAPLHDSFIRAETSYSGKTYLDIVQIALAEAGVDPGGVVLHSNAANRKAITGSALIRATEPKGVEEIVLEKGPGGAVFKTVVARMSERWGEFIRTHLDRAGLFLWATASGDFVLGAPNPNQEPLYSLTLDPAAPLQSGGFRGGVRRDEYRNSVEPPRYSEVIIYSRAASKKFGRGKVKGGFVDQEMLDLGIDRPLTMRDADVANVEQAERFAQRKLAEGRRSTFGLRYSTHGHLAIARGGAGRVVWAPDTVVALDDREAGLKGNFYIESCRFRRSEGGGTTTQIKLLRPNDVLFGSDEAA